MKVLHVYKNYRPETQGGVEQVITDICQGTTKSGHQADVFVTAPVDALNRTKWLDHCVVQARRTFEVASTPFSLEMSRRFDEIAEGYDLLHFHFPWPYMDMLQGLSRLRRPYVVTYHSDIIRQKKLLQLYKPLMMRFLNRARAVVPTSPNYLSTSPVLSRVTAPKRVIPLGIDPSGNESSLDDPVSPEVQRILNSQTQFFFFVGVLRYYKGLNFLIEAASRIRSRVVIAGDGPERGALIDLVKQRRAENVTFLGRVNDTEKRALLNRAIGFAFPSHERSEAFGVSLLEAAAAHLPMVSCEIGTGTSYVNLDGQTGFVVPPQNPMAFAVALQKLEDDAETRHRMGAEARKRFLANFTAERMTGEYLDLYKFVLGVRDFGKSRGRAP